MKIINNMNLTSRMRSIKDIYFNILLAAVPLSFIAGNMIININVLLLILSPFLFKDNIFKINYFILDKIIVAYFFLILFSGVFNDYKIYFNDNDFASFRGFFETTTKSLLFFKYLFLYIALRFLIENRIINLKFFFLSSFIATTFVCLDIFYQFFMGKDIFGYEIHHTGRKLSGPFGDELIAGGFIQRFSLFSFFLLPLFYREISKKYLKILIPLLFTIFLFGLILSGNRMPFILFLICIFLILIFQKQIRIFIIPFFLTFSLIFSVMYNMNSEVKSNFNRFQQQISSIAENILTENPNNKNSSLYYKQFSSFHGTWLMNKYFGGGIKNFRYYCHHRANIDINAKFKCNMHPHNYYLEILTETGLIGFFVISSIFLIIFYISFIKKYFYDSYLKDNHIITPFIFLFLVEVFPIKSTGSFFTTGNTTYLFFIIGILIALLRKNKLIEKKR